VPALLRRRVVIPVLVAVVALVAVLGVALARSRTSGCDVAAPAVNLPAELRTLGGFDQAYDPAADPQSILDASVGAASALHSDLAGAHASALVRESADGGATYDALVVPLAVPGAGTGESRVVGVVAWLLDCSGRAWYDDVRDVLRTDPSLLPTGFPTVDRATATARLGASALRLVYRTSPFQPLWLDPASGRTLPAGLPS